MNSITKKILSLLLVLCVFFGAASQSFAASISSSQKSANEKKIYLYLRNSLGLNAAAASGVLANIEIESGFNPNLWGDYQRGVATSYGICQWHAGRFTSLKNYCAKYGYNYTTLDGQLKYLEYELRGAYKTKVYNRLLSVSNNADGAARAGHDWCYYFEVPAGYNRGVSDKRGTIAKNTYWPKYKNDAASSGSAAVKTTSVTTTTAAKTTTTAKTTAKTTASGASSSKLSNGSYVIRNVNTKKYLSSIGLSVNKGAFGAVNPLTMKLTASGNGYTVTPVGASSGLYMTVSGTAVRLKKSGGNKSGVWIFEKVPTGYLIRSAANTNMVMSSTGSQIVLVPFTGASAQVWTVTKA